jgi:predicted PurR-regulated permease PerM
MRIVGASDRWIWAVLVLLLSTWLLRSFVESLLWAFFIALATWPLYRRFSSLRPLRARSSVRALLFTGLVAVFGLGPFAFAFTAIARQVQSWAPGLAAAESHGIPPPDWLGNAPLAGPWLVDQWKDVLGTAGGVSRWLHQADNQFLVRLAAAAGHFVLHHVTIVAFMNLALFFIYRGGEPLAERIGRLIAILGPRGDAYFRLAAGTVRATMIGLIVVVVMDGALVGVGYFVAGLPSPLIWAAMTAVLAIIPFLSYIVLAVATLVLLSQGAGLAATALFVWGCCVIFASDKIVRPALIGSTTHLGFFWVLVGTLGGVETFGLLGIIVGPVILTLAHSLWREYTDARPWTPIARADQAHSP